MTNILELNNVSWRREGNMVLTDINWRIQRGDHSAIIGLNGSGKTTLLNIITGYSWPTKGTIHVLGHAFGKIDLRELRKSIGWVSSSLQERIPLSDPVESIVVSGKFASFGVYECTSYEDAERARQLIHEFGITHLAGRSYQTCSQGEKQKVLIARALMNEPKLLILDEPCTGLDVFSREQLLLSIEQLANRTNGPTLIYVTHHIDEIIAVFNRSLLLRNGRIFAEGKTENLLNTKTLTDFFDCPVEVEHRYGRNWLKVSTPLGNTKPR